MTTNVFYIFLGLKAKEIWKFIESCAEGIIFLLLLPFVIGGVICINMVATTTSLWIIMYAYCYVYSLFSVFALGILFLFGWLIWLIYVIIIKLTKRFRKNWVKAKKISAERKKADEHNNNISHTN